jgi:hypothetical protein
MLGAVVVENQQHKQLVQQVVVVWAVEVPVAYRLLMLLQAQQILVAAEAVADIRLVQT